MLSCPFCKNKYVIIAQEPIIEGLVRVSCHYVTCPQCFARGPVERSKEEAEEAWNDTFIRE